MQYLETLIVTPEKQHCSSDMRELGNGKRVKVVYDCLGLLKWWVLWSIYEQSAFYLQSTAVSWASAETLQITSFCRVKLNNPLMGM